MNSALIHPRSLSRALIIFFSVFLLATAAHGQSVPGLQAPDKPKAKLFRSEVPFQGRIYGHLKLDAKKTKRLGQLSPSEQKRKKDEKLLYTGVVRPLTTPLDPVSDSALYTVAEGYIRVAGVVSEGAVAVRVQFKNMSLPQGARVFVYSPTNPNEYYGPYIGRGELEDGTFWTPAIRGDTAIIEYFTPAKGNSVKTPFSISSIAHIYKDLSVVQAPAASCELEVTADWQNVAKSVGRIDFVTGGFVAACTGTLLNNAANDQKPYFLTAQHCVNTQQEAQSAVVFWNYNTGDSPPFGTPTTTGAKLLATGSSSDFSLLFLTGSLPGGLFFSGWDASAFNGTAAGTSIHHPQASHKRISFGTARQPAAGNCQLGDQCLRVDWSSGITEAGSSGAGVWIGNPSDPGGPRLIGTLSGGLSSCNSPPSQMWDIYGRFSASYTSIASFLEANTCVTSISSTSQFIAGEGGSGAFDVTVSGSCNWTAVASDSFITTASNGTANGIVTFTVSPNFGPQRTGTIVVGGQVFTITQGGGGPCAPTPISIGQTVNGNLTTADCPADDGTFYDAYSFSATAGTRVSISLSSNDFDTFLILNRPDGSILSFNDDGGGGTNSRIPANGFITLPVNGTYTIWANAFDPDDTTGAYSLSISVPVLKNLTVASSNPNSGIVVGTTTDNNGISSGTTPFTLTYDQNTTVILNAPGTAPGNLIFLKWQRDGVDYSSTNLTLVGMDDHHTMSAVYGPVPTYVLTVDSTNPSSGVAINVSPNDVGGSGNGTTQFTRTYQQFTTVTVTAPISGGGNSYFQKWQQNGSDLTTNRSINVNMNGNQTVNAVYVTIPTPPPPSPTPTPVGPSQSVAYQIDPTHAGSQFDTVTPPLTQRWSRNLGSSVSYPLIALNKVFVTAGSTLQALNITTGATVWGPIEIGGYPNIAYATGRVFALNRDGLLRAFDATTGTQVWTRQLSGQAFSSPPTAAAGTVYVNSISTLYAVSVLDGNIKWSVPQLGSGSSSPAVTSTGVYLTNSGEAFAFEPATGSLIWRTSGFGIGSIGRTPVFYNSRVYIRENSIGNVALDAGTGIPVAEIPIGPAAAFHGSTGFFLNISTLEARDISSGALKWSFTGDGTLSSAPIVVNGVVYIGSTSGKLYAVDEVSGTNLWSGNVGAPVNRPDEVSTNDPLTGLGAGEGLIVVPASNLVVAYEKAIVSTPVIYAEEGTNNAVALDSVTFVRGPFGLSSPHNFSVDKRTRIILLTSALGLTQTDLSDPAALVVEASGVNLPVENVGAFSIDGISSSYIVVRLPDNVPTGALDLKVKLRGISSEAKTLNISP